MSPTPPKLIFGTAGIATFDEQKTLDGIITTLKKYNVKCLDTAYLYPGSEEVIGKNGLSKEFIIDTKAPFFGAGTPALTKENTLNGIDTSLKRLGLSSVETYYLHAPDNLTPIEETLSAIREIYAAGKFKYFGLSNYLPDDVQKIYDIQAAAGSVLPTVFEGNYNAVSRHIETTLFPLLRKLKIRFNAYSPTAGGFLVKSAATLRDNADKGRFGAASRSGPMYNAMYSKESLLQGLEKFEAIAKDAGITQAELATRWIAFHSALQEEKGDGLILGASKVEQLESSLTAVEKGPLDQKFVDRIDGIWEDVKEDAPYDNWHSYGSGGSQVVKTSEK
ncbi:hypothetical protein B7494_g6014 [Chlorociboria aeruginascens]|nr:hypothetical protein B7494_g6014 [Chlorociboria aeruginascens]